MGKKQHGGDFGEELQKLWASVDCPPFNEFLKELDDSLFKAFDEDASGIYWAMFHFFDSDPDNPLTPRELLEFDSTLTGGERLAILADLVDIGEG
ncbi:hypothetical protein [Streptomyces phage Psst1]|nr:hypothetical protein [Streptomyces phage Psst1]WPJ30682.1 hypothetical protein [Streptomyces phage Psst2]